MNILTLDSNLTPTKLKPTNPDWDSLINYGKCIDSNLDWKTQEQKAKNMSLIKHNFKDDCWHHPSLIYYLSCCWSNHYGVVISPHVIWNTILCEIAKHIKDNSELYRDLFTDSSDKKDIIVPETDPEVIDLNLIMEELKRLVPTNVDLFIPKFSTSTEDSNLASYAAFCDAMSVYYNYMMLACGIPKIRIEGTEEDWGLIQTSLYKMLDLFRNINNYLLEMISVVSNIKNNSFSGIFWEDFFTLERCGSGSQQEVKGWVTKFYINVCSLPTLGNFPKHISKVDYSSLSSKRKFSMSYGLFESFVDGEGFLVPQYKSIIYERFSDV